MTKQDTVRYIVHTKGINHKTARCIRKTQRIYCDALVLIIGVCVDHWDEIKNLAQLAAKTKVERMIHATKKNTTPDYPDFDKKFPKFPTYLRRDAIARAIGYVSSFQTNSARYDEIRRLRMSNGMRPQKKHAPSFNDDPFIAPSFYKDNMYVPNADGSLSVKLWDGKDWAYHRIQLRSKDAHYISKKAQDGWEMASPSLIRHFGNWVFAFVMRRKLPVLMPEKNAKVIVGVDLGIGNDAVCSAMLTNGTVIARRFIRLASEKDRLEHLRNRRKGIRSVSGRYASTSHISTKILGISEDIACQTAHQIAAFAKEVNADVVVFEHLSENFSGSEKLAHWRNREVFHKACGMLHRMGIRYATVNPWHTSKLAFDGSGLVKRGHDVSPDTPYDVCRFTTGKIYNCDLNASYNIGARYLMRLLESNLGRGWSYVMAKVPDAAKRTKITLATYLDAFAVSRAVVV